MKKVIFLDRDGTLIKDRIYLNDPSQIEYLPGVFEGLIQLRDQGFEFVVVTNQSGVPRGLVELKNLWNIHKIIRGDMARRGIDILAFDYAPFLPASNHPMRKPNPGMLKKACGDYGLNPQLCWMVGDRMTDVEAGRRHCIRSLFLQGTEDPHQSPFAPPEFCARDFLELTQYILNPQKI